MRSECPPGEEDVQPAPRDIAEHTLCPTVLLPKVTGLVPGRTERGSEACKPWKSVYFHRLFFGKKIFWVSFPAHPSLLSSKPGSFVAATTHWPPTRIDARASPDQGRRCHALISLTAPRWPHPARKQDPDHSRRPQGVVGRRFQTPSRRTRPSVGSHPNTPVSIHPTKTATGLSYSSRLVSLIRDVPPDTLSGAFAEGCSPTSGRQFFSHGSGRRLSLRRP